jgi:ubiquitin-protein ligase
MMGSVYQRRIEQEWKLLLALAAENPEILQDCRREDQAEGSVFRFELLQTPSPVEQDGQIRVEERHSVSFHFPRFFPAVPIEASLARPVFHPNVHPETGFVCLWDRLSSGDTVVEAVAKLQQVITWRLFNVEELHVMQPKSLQWYEDPVSSRVPPFIHSDLKRPDRLDFFKTSAVALNGTKRRRLH